MRACEISERLGLQIDAVVRHLLPRGKRTGSEWCVGDANGDPGQSLRVHLGADKPGVWSDFTTGESGDAVGLWMAVRKLSLREACAEALNFLGISDDRPAHHGAAYKRPTREGVQRLNAEHTAWLRDVRKLPDATVAAYRLASREDRLMFPYLRGGELVFAKYRRLPKTFSAEAECEPILFGWQALSDTARSVILAEGELDALAWYAYGFPALSVPTGAGATKWIASEYAALERFDTIYLSMDMDDAGQRAVSELCERLGRERTRVVRLPHKDANECLIAGVLQADMACSLRDARTLDPSELRNAADYEDAIIAEGHRTDEGMVLPWKKTHDTIKLRPGECSILAGVNGHGKTVVASQIVAYQAMHAGRCCVASMEWRAPLWMRRMTNQIAGVANATDEYRRHIVRMFRETLWAFDVAGATKSARIIDVFEYARRRYRIEFFLIDNLTKCGFADDDYSGQKQFVEALADFARTTDCHVMIVAHMRKGESEDHPSGKMGVKGSGGITDMAQTVFEVWRNKARERAKAIAEQLGEPLPEKFQPNGPCGSDALLITHKQNATGKEPRVRLWFEPDTMQFLASPDHKPRAMVPLAAMQSFGSAA